VGGGAEKTKRRGERQKSSVYKSRDAYDEDCEKTLRAQARGIAVDTDKLRGGCGEE
jgi:hypothetical protein